MIWPNKGHIIFANLLEHKKYTIREDNDLWISLDDSMFMAVITKDWPIHGGHLSQINGGEKALFLTKFPFALFRSNDFML